MSLLSNIKNFFFDDKIYYFDNNATTLIYDQNVYDIVNKWLSCANPSNNLHTLGEIANKQVLTCHKYIAYDLSVNPEEIYFTGSATEGNNIIIQGIVNESLKKYSYITIITSAFEHPSVLNVFKNFKNDDRINVIYIPIDTNSKSRSYGLVDLNILQDVLQKESNIVLVSIMYANNETGAINDIKRIGQMIRDKNLNNPNFYTFFHSDCTQMIGKEIIKPKELFIDSITFSGHKFHAPKGVGCLYIRMRNDKCPINGMCFGGEQEESIRPGTENVAYISALSYALINVHKNRKEKNSKLQKMKKYLVSNLQQLNCLPIIPAKSLNNTILFILPEIDICNNKFCYILSRDFNICLGTSSACQTKKVSHVLSAMGLEKYKSRIIRLSMSDYTTEDECVYLIEKIKYVLNKYKEN